MYVPVGHCPNSSDLRIHLDTAAVFSYSSLTFMQSLLFIIAITKTQVCENNDVTEGNVVWSNVETEQSQQMYSEFSLRYCHGSPLSWLQGYLGAVFRNCNHKYFLKGCCMPCTVDTVLNKKDLVPPFLKSYALVENAADIKEVIEMCWILWKTSTFQGYLTHLGGRKTLVTSCYQYAFPEHTSSLNINVWLLIFLIFSHPFLNQSLFQNKFESKNSFLALKL